MSEESAERELLQHQFPALDSMRAIGALAVFTTHVAFWSGAYTGNGVWGTLLARLDVGVAIFFVLSGFLLSRPFLARASVGRPRPALGRYYWKRFLRIAPLYVFTALLALALIKKNDVLGARDWLVTLFMGDTFLRGTMPNGLTQMWSLAVEVSFYLILPLLMAIAVGRPARLRARRVVALVCVMAAVSVAWNLWGAPWAGEWTSGQPDQWLPAYLGWFGDRDRAGARGAPAPSREVAAAHRRDASRSLASRGAAGSSWPAPCSSLRPRSPDRRCSQPRPRVSC